MKKDENLPPTTGLKAVDILDYHRLYNATLVGMLCTFSNMWNGTLGQILAARYRYVLRPERMCPVHIAPYHTGPVVWKLAAPEIDEILKHSGIDPGLITWARPIAFASTRCIPSFLCTIRNVACNKCLVLHPSFCIDE